MLKINPVTAIKIAGYVSSALGGTLIAYANGQDNKKAALKLTEKIVSQHLANK